MRVVALLGGRRARRGQQQVAVEGRVPGDEERAVDVERRGRSDGADADRSALDEDRRVGDGRRPGELRHIAGSPSGRGDRRGGIGRDRRGRHARNGHVASRQSKGRCRKPAQRRRVGRLERVRNAGQKHPRLRLPPGDLHLQPARLAGGEKVGRQTVRIARAELDFIVSGRIDGCHLALRP